MHTSKNHTRTLSDKDDLSPPIFDLSTTVGRRANPFVQVGKVFIPGIRRVQNSIKPYAKAWYKTSLEAIEGEESIWVALGDSMSQGVGASAHNKGWVGQAASSLASRGHQYQIVNLASTGARIEDVLRIQLPALHALNIKPALVTVLIGSNDLIIPRHRKRLVTNLELLLEQLPSGTVVGNVFDKPGLPAPFKHLFVSSSASHLLESTAPERELIVVPLGEAFRPPWRGKIASDLFHPNDRGYEGIAQAFVETILSKRN